MLHPRDMDGDTALKFLSTKFAHWRYEAELRAFLSLEAKDPQTGLYFADFSDRLALKEVVVGANAAVSRAELIAALGDLARALRIIKARLAFKTFNVVHQRKAALWA